MVIFSEPRHIPQYRRSPDLSPPNYKALAIGINYTRSPDGSAPEGYALPLQGPVNDAKNMKETLKRACTADLVTSAFSLGLIWLQMSITIESKIFSS